METYCDLRPCCFNCIFSDIVITKGATGGWQRIECLHENVCGRIFYEGAGTPTVKKLVAKFIEKD